MIMYSVFLYSIFKMFTCFEDNSTYERSLFLLGGHKISLNEKSVFQRNATKLRKKKLNQYSPFLKRKFGILIQHSK